MSQAKRVSMRKRRGKAMPVLGAAGLLALVSGASAKAPADTLTPNTGMSRQVFLGEEEITDVSLATFYVFDKENANSLKPGVQLARGGCGGGCGCGHGWWWWRLQRLRRLRRWLLSWLRRRVRSRLRLSWLRRRLQSWASALAVAAVVAAQDAAWAGGESTA